MSELRSALAARWTADSVFVQVIAFIDRKSFKLALQICALALLCFIIYQPGLSQPPRSDQLEYLYLNHGIHSLYGLTIGDSTLNRSVVKGDTLLFRPVLYWFLGLELWTFGYHFVCWQLTNLVLHVSTVIALLFLLRSITKDGALSFAIAVLFAGAFAGAEIVTWQHLSGYLLFCLLLMLGMLALHRYLQSGRPAPGYAAASLIAVSAFTYELGNVAALLMAVMVGWSWFTAAPLNKKNIIGVAFCLACIPLVYAALSLTDLYVIFGTIIPSQIPGSSASHQFVQNHMDIGQAYLFYADFWLVTIFVPTLAYDMPGSRMMTGPLLFPSGGVEWLNVCCALSFAMFLFAALLSVLLRKTRPDYASGAMTVIILACLLAYDAIIVVGRGAAHDYAQELYINSYYVYMFALLAILLAGVVLGSVFRSANLFVKSTLLVVLFVNAAFASAWLYRCEEAMQAYALPRVFILNQILKAEAAAPKDRPFTFSVLPSCLNDAMPGVVNWPLREERASFIGPFSVAYVLWPDAYRAVGGEMQVDCSSAK